jgi:two-component system response regulator
MTMEILLVEDNPNDAELAILAIRQAKYTGRITHVDDGVKALDYLSASGAYLDRAGARPPRVVFLDLKLPRLDGIEVLRRVKNSQELKAIPVVMLTSSQELSDVDECYRLGVNSYVVKPVNFDDYQSMINGLVNYWTRLNQAPMSASPDGSD